MFLHLSNWYEISQSTPFEGQASSQARRLVTSSDIIRKIPSALLADIVNLFPLGIAISLTILKRAY